MRVVLDTNILVSGIFWAGLPGQLLHHWLTGRVELIATIEILAEYDRVLNEVAVTRGRADLARRWVNLIAEHVTLVDVLPGTRICRDPDDDKYLDCVVQGGADLLVSGDKDLLSLGSIKGISIVTAKQALAALT